VKLIHRSQVARNPVRAVSAGEELFVGAVVGLMLFVTLGDVIGPVALGELGLELALFDLGGEAAVLAFEHWGLAQILCGAAVITFAVSVVRVELLAMVKALVSALGRGLDKIPI
jgi:hypothetical protein